MKSDSSLILVWFCRLRKLFITFHNLVILKFSILSLGIYIYISSSFMTRSGSFHRKYLAFFNFWETSFHYFFLYFLASHSLFVCWNFWNYLQCPLNLFFLIPFSYFTSVENSLALSFQFTNLFSNVHIQLCSPTFVFTSIILQ